MTSPDSETEAFRQQFPGSLRQRGLQGVRLVIADAHRADRRGGVTVHAGLGPSTVPGSLHP